MAKDPPVNVLKLIATAMGRTSKAKKTKAARRPSWKDLLPPGDRS